ncbi:MAG: hypothetical protein AB1815_06485 [Bacillota bacterium]
MDKANNAIEQFTRTIPPPWAVTVWTVPADGTSPSEYTAGYFSFLADRVAFSPGTIVFSGEHGIFYFIEEAVGPVERLADGVIQFGYVNLKVTPEGFTEPVYVTIARREPA